MIFIPRAVIAQNALDQPAAAPTAAETTPAAIPADQQATKEQLAKLFETMRLRAQLQSYMKMIPAMVQKQIQEQFTQKAGKIDAGSLKPDQRAALDKLMTKYTEKAATIIGIDELLDDMSEIYQRHVSRSDVDAMIVFYGSPAGQHLLDAQPAIMQEYMPVVMKRMRERSTALNDEMIADLAEFVKSQKLSTEPPAAK
jgi:hypothetical protein